MLQFPHPIPLFSPHEHVEPISVLCVSSTLSGLVSPWQGLQWEPRMAPRSRCYRESLVYPLKVTPRMGSALYGSRQ